MDVLGRQTRRAIEKLPTLHIPFVSPTRGCYSRRDMSHDDIYRPPATDLATNHSTFTADEWRYIGKAFAAWFLGGSLLLALVTTLQLGFALSQFGGEEYVTRFVALRVVSREGASLVIFAACNTLVMVTHRRAKVSILQPIQKMHLWIPGCLGLTTPIAMALICGWSLVISTYGMRVPWADASKALHGTIYWTDFASSILSVMVVGTLVVALVPQMMRLLFRFRGWLILKLFIMTLVAGLFLSAMHSLRTAIVSH